MNKDFFSARGKKYWADGTPYGVANRSGPPADDELDAILRRAWSAGIRTLDTARAYGESEARLGPRLADRSCADGWRVITKLDPGVYTEGQGLEESLARIAESLAAVCFRMFTPAVAALSRIGLPVLLGR